MTLTTAGCPGRTAPSATCSSRGQTCRECKYFSISKKYFLPLPKNICRTCYSSDPYGGYGMNWFDALQCCYYQQGYLAEPQNQAEQDAINSYLTICEQHIDIEPY